MPGSHYGRVADNARGIRIHIPWSSLDTGSCQDILPVHRAVPQPILFETDFLSSLRLFVRPGPMMGI